MFGYNEKYVKEHVDEIKEYHSDVNNFEKVDNKCKKITRATSCKGLIRDLNKRIDIDFIKESEEIENGYSQSIMKFLKSPNTKILQALPSQILFQGNKDGEELDDFRKDIFKSTKLIAVNPKQKKWVDINHKNHLYALRKLFDEARKSRIYRRDNGKFKPLTHAEILETNGCLGENDYSDLGRYRSPFQSSFTKVEGANWTPVSNARVSDNMDALLEWYNNNSQGLHPFVRAAVLHAEFIRIHPFVDGNGRTARLLMNYELIRNGYPSVVIKARDKEAYINALNHAITTKDVTDLVKIIESACDETANEYINYIEDKKAFDREMR